MSASAFSPKQWTANKPEGGSHADRPPILTRTGTSRRRSSWTRHSSSPCLRASVVASQRSTRQTRTAFSLVESVISVFLVGLLLVSALNAVGASAMTQRRMADKTRGRHLAEMLMNEILTKAYEDPNQAPNYGLESGEVVTNRATLDDVDDYFGYDQPVTDMLGAALPAYPGWRWRVTGSKISVPGIADRNGSDTGTKRIKVQAVRDDEVFAEAIGFRTYVWEGFTAEGIDE